MALTPKLEIRQSQSLLMTPQLRQAINLLQLSNIELNQLLEQELNNNPLLVREDDQVDSQPDQPATPLEQFNLEDQSLPIDNPDFSPDLDYDNQFDDFGSDRESYQVESNYSSITSNHSAGPASDDYDFFEQSLAAEKTLCQLIDEQISLHFTSARQKFIAGILAEQLDAAGYFRGNLSEMAQNLKTSEFELRSVLEVMKGFEPSGIFAENLADCLTIQLRDLDRCDPAMTCLLQHLDLLANRNFKELKKLCQCDDEDLASMINDIKSLNPKPAASYNTETAVTVIPDVLVTRGKYGDYRIELNNQSLPRLLINYNFYSELMTGNQTDKSAKRYLKENLRHAGFLIRSLHQRATTILRVSEAIVNHQRAFFEYGINHLKPMNLKDIAYELELNESTVSRVTNHKYMHTPRGLFELKYFFSSAAGTFSGNEDTSTTAIKHRIKTLIETEKAEQILSDDQIVEILAQTGIKIARRTVAKYREAMNIPTSAQRKRQKRSPQL